MEEDILFTHPMCLKEVMQLADDGVGTLPTIPRLITEEIDLPGECLTVHPKYCTLPWSEEVDWSWLKRVTRKVDLLSVIKGIMDFDRDRVRRGIGSKRRRFEVAVLCVECSH